MSYLKSYVCNQIFFFTNIMDKCYKYLITIMLSLICVYTR